MKSDNIADVVFVICIFTLFGFIAWFVDSKTEERDNMNAQYVQDTQNQNGYNLCVTEVPRSRLTKIISEMSPSVFVQAIGTDKHDSEFYVVYRCVQPNQTKQDSIRTTQGDFQ